MPRDEYFYLLVLNHSLPSILLPCPCDWWSSVRRGLNANFVLHKMIKLLSFPIIFVFVWQICQFKAGTELWPVALLSCNVLASSLSVFICWFIPDFGITWDPTVLKSANQPSSLKNILKCCQKTVFSSSGEPFNNDTTLWMEFLWPERELPFLPRESWISACCAHPLEQKQRIEYT